MIIIDILRWTASINGIIAAAMIAINAGLQLNGWGFVPFCGSSVVWIATSLLDGNNQLAIQNVVLLGINLFGVYRYLWREQKPAPAG
jgi:hypothetical protein